MGEIPSGPLFSVKLCFAVALLTSVGISVGQGTSAPSPVSPPQNVTAPYLYPSASSQPGGSGSTKADVLMARENTRLRFPHTSDPI